MVRDAQQHLDGHSAEDELLTEKREGQSTDCGPHGLLNSKQQQLEDPLAALAKG